MIDALDEIDNIVSSQQKSTHSVRRSISTGLAALVMAASSLLPLSSCNAPNIPNTPRHSFEENHQFENNNQSYASESNYGTDASGSEMIRSESIPYSSSVQDSVSISPQSDSVYASRPEILSSDYWDDDDDDDASSDSNGSDYDYEPDKTNIEDSWNEVNEISAVSEVSTILEPICEKGLIQEQECEITSSPCLGYQQRACNDGQWTSWSSCSGIRQIKSDVLFSRPQVSDYTIAALGLNLANDSADEQSGTDKQGKKAGKPVYLIDLPSGEVVLQDGAYAQELLLDGHFLSGVNPSIGNTNNTNNTGNLVQNNCQVLDLIYGDILYDGSCPQDLDKTLYVTKIEEKILSVGNAFYNEELASLKTDDCISHPLLENEVVVFAASPFNEGSCQENDSSLYVWQYVDEWLAKIPVSPPLLEEKEFEGDNFEGNNPEKNSGEYQNHDPLFEKDILLFSRSGSEKIELMRYDFSEKEGVVVASAVLPPAFLSAAQESSCAESSGVSYADWTKKAAFNGTTLVSLLSAAENCATISGVCQCVSAAQLTAYNLTTGNEAIIYTNISGGSSPSPPSIDENYIVWEEEGVIQYCLLKEGWKGE